MFDSIVDGVVGAIKGLSSPFTDLFDWEDTLDPWTPDFWRGEPRGTARSGPSESLAPTGDFSRWMQQYDNGRIPVAAMVQIPGGGYLRPDAASAFMAMYEAAKADGVTITVGASGSAYRDLQTQVQLAEQKGLYSQGGLAARPGTSFHGWGLAVDVGEGAQRTWLAKNGASFGFETISREPWHWQYNGNFAEAYAASPERKRKQKTPGTPQPTQPTLAPLYLLPEAARVSSAFTTLFSEEREMRYQAAGQKVPAFKGAQGSIKQQLYQGFMDAGRPDLAKMVNTKDFHTWIQAESGWNPYVTSQYFPGHGRNYGLFQFWERHPWTDQYVSGGQWAATPYEQAQLVAQWFAHLEPGDIRNYAQQIRSGSYHGWG